MDSSKRILAVAIIVTVILGCVFGYLFWKRGQEPGTSGGQVELVYWGLWEPESHMQEVIDNYEKENPNITINYSHERFTQYEENVYARLSDPQTTPDIIRINNAWTYKFQTLLSPLPPEIMTTSEYQESFYPGAFRDFMGTDGYLYAIPLEIDGLGLYYNKDLFSRAGITSPPADWDTFIETAKSLTITDSSGNITQAGAAIGCANNINHSADILTALMMQNNVQMTTQDGTQVAFNTDRGEDTITYYTNFVNEHSIWSCALRNDLEMFSGGTLAMMFGPSWRVFDVITMNSSINFDTAPLPQLVGNNQPVNYGMYWGEAVSAQSAHQLEAWKFIKYLSEQEQLQTMYAAQSKSRTFGEPYSRPDMADSIKDAPYVGPFIEMAPYYQSWQMPDQKTSEAALNKAITAVVDGGVSVSSSLDEAAKTIDDALSDLYGL